MNASAGHTFHSFLALGFRAAILFAAVVGVLTASPAHAVDGSLGSTSSGSSGLTVVIEPRFEFQAGASGKRVISGGRPAVPTSKSLCVASNSARLGMSLTLLSNGSQSTLKHNSGCVGTRELSRYRSGDTVLVTPAL